MTAMQLVTPPDPALPASDAGDDAGPRRARPGALPLVECLRSRTAKLEQRLERARQEREALESRLRQAESEQRLATLALATTQEMERKRIAGELHDSIGQSLSFLGLAAGLAHESALQGDLSAAQEQLAKLASHVRYTVTELRRIVMDLRPAAGKDIGMLGTLSWFFREFRALHPEVALIVDIGVKEEDIAPALRTTLFRVVQEALNNVIKHSRAAEVQVGLQLADQEIRLQIADNGCGFTLPGRSEPRRASANGLGTGLRGLRERVEFSGGKFAVSTQPGQGTTIAVHWPLRRR